MSSSPPTSTVAHCPSDKRTVSIHIRQPYQKSKRKWEENSPLTSKLVSRAVSLHTKQPYQKRTTWEENSLLTSKLFRRATSLHTKQSKRTWEENSLLTSKLA